MKYDWYSIDINGKTRIVSLVGEGQFYCPANNKLYTRKGNGYTAKKSGAFPWLDWAWRKLSRNQYKIAACLVSANKPIKL